MIKIVTHKNIMTVAYWEACAPWYALWLAHNDYHRRVKDVLLRFVRPNWSILDIGGGSGVLTSFLRAHGCRAVLLEPARSMRALFASEQATLGESVSDVEERTWEDVPIEGLGGYDLTLACNSLHVTSMGFSRSLDKMFAVKPGHVFVAAESLYANGLDTDRFPGYSLTFAERLEIQSSYAYHTLDQALRHASFQRGRSLGPEGRERLASRLTFEAGHYRLKGTAELNLFLWSRAKRSGS